MEASADTARLVAALNRATRARYGRELAVFRADLAAGRITADLPLAYEIEDEAARLLDAPPEESYGPFLPSDAPGRYPAGRRRDRARLTGHPGITRVDT